LFGVGARVEVRCLELRCSWQAHSFGLSVVLSGLQMLRGGLWMVAGGVCCGLDGYLSDGGDLLSDCLG
jgi:hypothetical protein